MAFEKAAVLGGLWVQRRRRRDAQRLAGLGEALEGLWRAAGGGIAGLELEGCDAGSEVRTTDEGTHEKGELVVLFTEALGPALVGVGFPGEVAGGIVVEEGGLCDGVQTLRCTAKAGQRGFVGTVLFGV